MAEQEIDLEADGAVNDLCDRYGDAVTTLHRIYLSAQGYDIHKEKESQNAWGFAGWMKSFMADLKYELKKHGVECE